MTVVTLWLLITVGYKNDNPHVLERFQTVEECQRVLSLTKTYWARCVQANVSAPHPSQGVNRR